MQHHAFLYRHITQLPDFSNVPYVDRDVLQVAEMRINDVRALQKRVYKVPITPTGKRVVCIECVSMRVEAQNALLKLLEEPPERTEFHVVVAEPGSMLATLRSRFANVHLAGVQHGDIEGACVAFLTTGYRERIETIAQQSKESSDWVPTLVRSCMAAMFKDARLQPYRSVILNVEAQLSAPGSSPKMLAEHLALTMPILNKIA